MKKVEVYLIRETDGSFSCCMDDNASLPYGLIGEGNTVAQAIKEWENVYEAMRQSFAEDGQEFPEATFSFAYDVPSFLMYYAGKFSFSGLAKLTGISAAQLSQYAHGYRKPSARTTEKIQTALHNFGQELCQIQLV